MQANGPAPQPQPHQPQPSPQFLNYLKEVRRRRRFDLFEKTVATLVGSIFYGLLISLSCFVLSHLFLSIIGVMTLQLMIDVTLNYANLIPGGLGPWILFGTPALVFGYTLLYAIKTNTHGFHFSANGFLSSLVEGLGYGGPFVGFMIGLGIGMPLLSTLALTWGLGAVSWLYLTSDCILEAVAALSQPLPGMPVPPQKEAAQQQAPAQQIAPAQEAAPPQPDPLFQNASAITPAHNQARGASDQAAQPAQPQPVQHPNLDPDQSQRPNL